MQLSSLLITHPWKLSYIDRYLRDINWEAGHYQVSAHQLSDALPLTIQYAKIVSIHLQSGHCQLHDNLNKLDQVRSIHSDGPGVVFARLFLSPSQNDKPHKEKQQTEEHWLLLGRRDGIVDIWSTRPPTKRLYQLHAFQSEIATATLHYHADQIWLFCGAQDGRLVVTFFSFFKIFTRNLYLTFYLIEI